MLNEPDWIAMGPVGSAVPPEIRAEIGFVVMFQGSIEYELRFSIARLLAIDQDTAETATAELSYKQLVGFLSSLVIRRAGKDSEAYKDFATAVAGLDRFEAFRNMVAHSHWSHSVQDMSLRNQAARHKSTAKRGRGLVRTVDEVRLEDIQLEVKKAYFFHTQVYRIITEITQ